MTTAEWYVEMGLAVQKHKRAVTMRDSWQRKVDKAETEVEAVAARAQEQGVTPEQAEQAQVQE